MSGVNLGKEITEVLFKEAEERGLDKPAEFFLAAVRVTESNCTDRFEDILIAVSRKYGAYAYRGTTKPGVKGTQNPVEYKGVTGAAWVLPGFYKDVYQLGIHAPNNPSFKHEAFRQVGAFLFARDTNKDGDIDICEPTQMGDDTAINFHRASFLRNEEYVGAYGIACMVGQDHLDHEQAVKWWKETSEYASNEKARLSFLLLTQEEAQKLGIIF